MKFISNAGFIIETNDQEKIEVFLSEGLTEYKENPQPNQKDIEVSSDFVVKKKPVKKKK